MNNELFHTSPERITKITKDGRFGEFLFFAGQPYYMTASANAVLYSIDADELNLVEASQVFYQDWDCMAAIVAEFAAKWDVSEDDAVEVLSNQDVYTSGRAESMDWEDAQEMSWDAQLYVAKCAKAAGFDGVEVFDEQGAAYLIDLSGKESMMIEQEA